MLLLSVAVVTIASRLGGARAGLAASALSLAAMASSGGPFSRRAPLAQFAAVGILISALGEQRRRLLLRTSAADERLNLFAEAAKEYGVFSLDSDGKVSAWWNSALERLTGFGADELRGKPFAALFPLGEGGEAGRLLRRASTEGSVVDEGWRVRKDGSRAWTQAAVSAVRGRRGELAGYTVVARDMTRRRLEEERFRVALESAPSGMLLVDAAGRVVYVNAQAEALFGYRREELLGRAVETLVPERFRASHEGYREAYRRAPSMRRMGVGRDLFALRKDGGEFPVEIGLAPVRAEEGTLVIASVVDVTERQRAQAQLRLAYEELERQVAELEEFSLAVTHDLRAPLRHVAGFGQLLASRMAGRIGPEEQELLGRMGRAVASMDRMILDVLDLGRAARRPAELVPVDVNAVLKDVLERYPLGQAEVRVRARLPPVKGSEVLLTQVLSNLLSNAVKFVPDGRTPVVEVAAERRGDRVRLSVTDNGIGVPLAFRERLFKPFVRLPGPFKREGSGMGLAIVRKAAERMGGAAGLESEPGSGSTFWVDLPAAPP